MKLNICFLGVFLLVIGMAVPHLAYAQAKYIVQPKKSTSSDSTTGQTTKLSRPSDDPDVCTQGDIASIKKYDAFLEDFYKEAGILQEVGSNIEKMDDLKSLSKHFDQYYEVLESPEFKRSNDKREVCKMPHVRGPLDFPFWADAPHPLFGNDKGRLPFELNE